MSNQNQNQENETYQIIFNSQGSNLLSPKNNPQARTAITYDIN